MLTSQTQPVSASHRHHGQLRVRPERQPDRADRRERQHHLHHLQLPRPARRPSPSRRPRAYTSAANSTTTDSYDADGNLVTQDLPGGVQVTDSYDAMGDLTSQSGTGASAPTATRTFTYDAAGRMLTAATSAAGTQGSFGYQPATSESFSYDDRGLLLSAAGSAGTSTFSYNGSGQLDLGHRRGRHLHATPTTAPAGWPPTPTPPPAPPAPTPTTASDQVTQISYGTGNDTQGFGYDSLHRLISDTVTTAGGAQVAAIGYGYDANNDVTSMTTSGLATAGGGPGRSPTPTATTRPTG